jgi:hypothetical protein
VELAPDFPSGAAGTRLRLSLARKAAQGVDGAAAGNDLCRSGDAYGLRRRIVLSAIDPECPGDLDRYGERHVGIDPAVRYCNTDGELEQKSEIRGEIDRWRRITQDRSGLSASTTTSRMRGSSSLTVFQIVWSSIR